MSDILSQAEIEALLGSLNGDPSQEAAEGANSAASGAPAPRGQHKAAPLFEVYDFRRPDKFSKDQLRTMQMLHETFARLGGSALSAFLRSQVNIDLVSLEQIPYEEYLRNINNSVFTVMAIPPLNGQAVLEIEFGTVLSMIDKLLGGPGKPIERNNLTEIEIPLLRQMLDRLFGAFKSAWEGVVVVNPAVEAIETSAQFVQIAPPTDIVISILFEIRIGQTRGAMSLCVPYMLLKPVTTKLSAQRWFASGSRRQKPEFRRALVHQVTAAPVECKVVLGGCRLHVKDFLSLRSGDVVRLNQKSDRDILMHVANLPKFEGRPALCGTKLVYNVTAPYLES